MRALGLALTGLLLLLAGCSIIEKPKQRTISFLDRLRPGEEPQHDDLITLEMALVQRPIYDAFVEKDLWNVVDEQVGSMVARGALQANGLRVGELGGAAPSEFLHMITSDRSCTNPRNITIHSGSGTKLLLGPVQDHSHIELVQGTEIRPLDLDKAQYELFVTATLTEDGRTCLKCTPQVHHGEETTKFQKVSGGYWLPRPEQQVEVFAGLAWEVTASPSQFVVVGGRSEMPNSFGNQVFVRPGEDPPVRAVLVMRAVRATPGIASTAGTGALTPVLAIQAAQSADDAVMVKVIGDR
jgi:hypothetical protein